ncbi:MAG: PAS domain S-box protein [Dehalococcoidales bacterium]|nr:PAS domain S-box protein [Dehalococcoidales bacterium]
MSKRPAYIDLKKQLADAEAMIEKLKNVKYKKMATERDSAITERDSALLGIRELEEAYIESEQNFRNAMDICPLGVRIITGDGEMLYANQAMLNICGFGSYEELKAIPRKQLYTPESYAAHLERKELRERGECLTGEYEIDIRCPHGEVKKLRVFRKEIVWGGDKQFMSMYQDITERKRLEDALKKERKEYGHIIDSSPIIIFYKDTSGKFIHVNKAFAEALDIPEEAFIGKTVFDFYTSDISQSMTDDDNEVFNTGLPKLNIIERYMSARGLRWVQTDKIPIHDENKKIIGLVGFAQDITELEQAQERYQTILKTAIDGFWMVDLRGKILEVNDSYCKMTGYSREELLDMSIRDLEAMENQEDIRERIKRIMQKGSDRFETRHRCKDGEIIDVEISTNSLDIEGGRLSVFARDITERRKAEEEIRRSEEKYRSVVEVIPDGIVTIDTSGVITSMNKKAAEITGFSEEEIVGKHISKVPVITMETVPKALKIFASFMRGKGPSIVEIPCKRKDGTTGIGEFRASLMKTAGKITGIEVMARDVTERHQAEEALRESEEKFRELAESITDVYFAMDKNLHYTYWNKASEALLGIKAEDALGKHLYDIFPATEETKKAETAYRKVLKTKKPEQFTNDFNLDNRQFIFEISAYPTVSGLSIFVKDITKRKKAEEALRESEERFSKAFRSSPDRIVITRLEDGMFVDVNDSYLRFTGYTRDEIIGNSAIKLGSWVDTGHRTRIMQQLKKDGQVSGEEVRLRIKSGEIRTSLFSAELIDIKGEQCMISVATDITERKLAEEALSKNESLLNDVCNIGQIGGWEMDLTTRQAIWTKGLYDIVEIDYKDHVPGLDEHVLYYLPEYQPMVEEAMNALIDKGKPMDYEAKYLTAKGNVRWCHVIGKTIRENGKCIKVYGTAQDITHRKITEERIINLNRTLRSIRNINQLITREKDRDKMMKGVCNTLVESRSFNSAWIALLDDSRKLLGVTHSGFKSNFSPMLQALKRGQLPQCIKKALDKGQVVITRDPHSTCLECPLYPDFSGVCGLAIRLEYEGNVYGVLCASMPENILSDADEVSLFEEVATDIAFALHDITLEAEHELLEQERLRSDKLKSISTLAGGIAHDFNNLLTGIMGNIGLAKTYAGSSEKASETLEEAEKAAMHARDLTQQLLTFARGGKPVKKTVDIAGLIKESATFALRGSAAMLELSLPDDLFPTEVDEGQINQVIHNLVINADEAMPAGGTVNIRGMNTVLKKVSALPLPRGRYVRIDIQDSGIGISKAHLQRIFEPYFTTKKKGSGLGLSSAYSIIKNHGGYILAESTKNKGTTFHIYLPASGKVARIKSEPKQDNSATVGGRVLVMDDDETIRKMLSNMLKLAGYKAEITSDGAETLEKYAQALKEGKPFDAVIMDLTIPGGMGGKEAVGKLLKIDPAARVIVSSGYATDPIMSEHKKHGFSAVISKPYSVKELEETLHSLLSNK